MENDALVVGFATTGILSVAAPSVEAQNPPQPFACPHSGALQLGTQLTGVETGVAVGVGVAAEVGVGVGVGGGVGAPATFTVTESVQLPPLPVQESENVRLTVIVPVD